MISRLFLPLSSLASKGSIPWSSDQRNRHVHTHKGKSLPSRVLFPPCGVCCGCPEHFTVEMMSVKPTYQHLKGSANLIACGPCLSRQFCDSVCDKCSLCGRAPRDKRPAQDPPWRQETEGLRRERGFTRLCQLLVCGFVRCECCYRAWLWSNRSCVLCSLGKKKKKEKKKKKKTTEKVLLRCPVLARTWKACASKS